MHNHELRCEVIRDKAAHNRAMEEAERRKVVFASTPAIHSAPACSRFLNKIGLLPDGLAAQAQDERVLPAMIASGYRIPLHKLNEALANTTLDTYQKIVIKNRLSAVGLLD